MSALTDERLLTTGDVARIAGVSLETVRRWTELGRIEAIRVGRHGRYRYRASEVRRLIFGDETERAQ